MVHQHLIDNAALRPSVVEHQHPSLQPSNEERVEVPTFALRIVIEQSE